MDHLLVATDFSSRSDRALGRATLIAKRVGAALTLVHVVEADQPGRLIAADEAAASGLLSEMAATLIEEEGIAADWVVRVDDVDAGIRAAGEELGANLIVIGSHRHRLRDIFIGTTAERLVQGSSLPLLVAAEAPIAPYAGTLLALDFDEASKTAGRKALAMGVFEHTDVKILHAFDALAESMMRRSLAPRGEVDDYVEAEGEAAAEKLRQLMEDLELPSTCQRVVAIKGTAARTIRESAESAGSDLIVLGTNQRRGVERAVVGSVTADVIRDGEHDVLIIPVDEA